MTSKTMRIKRPRIRNTCDDGTGGGRVVVVVNIVVVVALCVVAAEVVVVINLAVEDNIAAVVVVGLVKNFLVEAPATLPTVGKFFGLSFVVAGLTVVVCGDFFMVVLLSSSLLDDMFGPRGLGCDVAICCC